LGGGGRVASSGSQEWKLHSFLKLHQKLTYHPDILLFIPFLLSVFPSLNWFYESCDRFHSKPFCEQDEGGGGQQATVNQHPAAHK
jgi:hypothetical protein